jgi:DNA-binding transcriptional regulator YhcF (GntR family)
MQGWIKLHREIKSNWLYQEKRIFSKFEAWVDLLLEVNHKDNKVLLGNELVDVKRGQTITSIRQLSARWGWSNTKIKQFFSLLQDDGMVSVKSDTKKTVITVEKYEFYQCMEDEKTTQNTHENDTKQTQKHTNKNVKNEKNEKNKKSSRPKFETCDMEMAELLFQKILINNPNSKKPNLESWANDIRLMREIDNRTLEQIKYLINWSQSDSFWKSNILSASKLRSKFDQLVIRCKEEKEKSKRTGKVKKSVKKEDFDLSE